MDGFMTFHFIHHRNICTGSQVNFLESYMSREALINSQSLLL